MSRKYKHGDKVPTKILATRLNELSDAITKGQKAIDREFVMRVPAELDHCPDLVMSQAARRLTELEEALEEIKKIRERLMPNSYHENETWQIADDALK